MPVKGKRKHSESPGTSPTGLPVKKIDSRDSPKRKEKTTQKQMFPPEETLVLTCKDSKFLQITLMTLQCLIIMAIGSNINRDQISLKKLKKSVLIHSAVPMIRQKLLGLTKLKNFIVSITAYDTKHKTKIQETSKKQETKSKTIYKIIWRYISPDCVSIKKQTEMIKKDCGIEAVIKEVKNPGFLLVTMNEDNKETTEFATSNFIYKLKDYKPNPKFCTNCSKFGHYAKVCTKSKPTCVNCSGQHLTKNCNNTIIKCTNCKGDHKAISKNCPEFKFQKEVLEQIMSKNLKRKEAIELVKSKSKQETSAKGANPVITNKQAIKSVTDVTKKTYSQALQLPIQPEIVVLHDQPSDNQHVTLNNEETIDIADEIIELSQSEINVHDTPRQQVSHEPKKLNKMINKHQSEENEQLNNLFTFMTLILQLDEENRNTKANKQYILQYMTEMIGILKAQVGQDSEQTAVKEI